MIISIDDVVAKNIKTFIECFESTKTDDEKLSYSCCIDGCQNKYTEKSSSIRHLRKHHKEIYEHIRCGKVEESVEKNKSQFSFHIRVKVNPNDILDACAELIAVHGLPICAVEYPAFKRILNPYVIALRMKGVELSIDKRKIKKHIKTRKDEIKKIIKNETKKTMVSLMIDIATRYNRSVLGISISYVHDGKICIRTIGLHVLKSSHTGKCIRDLIIQTLTDYDICLAQLVSITSDNGKNMIKAIALLDAIYQNHKAASNQNRSCDFPESTNEMHGVDVDDEDEYYIDPDVFDDEYYNDLLEEVRSYFEGPFDLIQGVVCGAHCNHLVVSHAIAASPETKRVIEECRTLVKKLRTPTFRSKLKAANFNMALLDVTTRWNSIYSMVCPFRFYICL